MSFGNQISIGKLGITGAIKQKLLEEHISVKNFDISVWQEIMDAIKDDENLKKIYTGSRNLRDKNAFQVAKETTVQISENLWNKVLNIVNRHNGTTTMQAATQQSQPISAATQLNSKPSALQRLYLQSEYPNLPFNSNGDIDFGELTLDKLKARFPESDYLIETNTEHGECITVKNKKNGKYIMTCANTTNFKGDKLQIVSFEHDGMLTQLDYQDGKFAQRTTFNIDEKNCFLDTQESFDKNGELISKTIWNKDNTSFITQEYSNGILCREITYVKNDSVFNITEDKNILLYKLIEDITKRNNANESGIGFLPKTNEIENNILNGISSNTVIPVLIDYKETTGRALMQDIIDNKLGLKYEKQKELLKHLTSMTRESSSAQHDEEHYFEGQSLGFEIQFALKNNDKEMLKEALGKVNKDNIAFVLNKIYNIQGNDNFADFSDKLYPQLLQMLGEDSGTYILNFGNSIIQHIYEKGGYIKDIVEDLNSNMDSWNKSVVNYTRLLNRCNAGHTSTITGKPDGKIDINNIQQAGTGDCWLIASILSATNKNQKGLDYINSMLSVDTNGNVTVELKGVNKKYVISAEEIEKSNHLASGDPDIRAIEIAIDKYMKELAYETTSNGNFDFSHADINGDFGNFAYQVIFGNGYTSEQPDIMNEDYNSENQVYSLSFGDNPNVKATVLSGAEQQEVDLIGRHAYAIKRSDEKYVYLINPHDSSETLQVDRSLLQTENPRVYYAEIERYKPKSDLLT